MNNPMRPHYKRKKPTTVQLTSLLDLLFVMVFVSLLQQKAPTPAPESPAKPVKVAKKPAPAPVKPKKVVVDIEATFNFYATSQNPTLPNGKYLMRGSFNTKTREIKLGGIGWIDRPKNYDMVPLSGTIGTSGKTLTGRIEFQQCKQFTLQKTSQTNGDHGISGEWKGNYECGQGATGLTLTIL